MERDGPIRILHVVTHMGPRGGGVPVWLLELMRRIDRNRYRFDFLVHTEEPQAFDPEVEALGGRLFRCPSPRNLWSYSRAFRKVVRTGGPFDVIHSHVLFVGHVLNQARKERIPVRVAHSHSDTRGFRADGHRLHGLYLAWTNRWVRHRATHGLACSAVAASALFGASWRDDTRWKLFDYGLDLTPFREVRRANALRREFGLPDGVPVVGHVGRFQPQKNHRFLFSVIAALARRIPNVRVLLVGDGPLREHLIALARSLAIYDRIVWAGLRPDVPQIMRDAMDCFVLPSWYEGLPLVGIEAQAAGLPLVIANSITSELDVTLNVTRLPPGIGAEAWAEAIFSALSQPRPDPQAAITAVAARFDIDRCVVELTKFYDSAIHSC